MTGHEIEDAVRLSLEGDPIGARALAVEVVRRHGVEPTVEQHATALALISAIIREAYALGAKTAVAIPPECEEVLRARLAANAALEAATP